LKVPLNSFLLIEGHEYLIQVQAVSTAGPGLWSLPIVRYKVPYLSNYCNFFLFRIFEINEINNLNFLKDIKFIYGISALMVFFVILGIIAYFLVR
jgi:hypothetical protein